MPEVFTDRKNPGYVTEDEGGEAEGEDEVFEGGSEVLPEGGVWAGIVGGKEQREHVNEAEATRGSDEKAENQGEANGKFAVGGEESDWRGVRQDKILQYGHHERVRRAVLQKSIDPVLEAAAKRELSAEDFVFAENQEKNADGEAKRGENIGIAAAR